MNMRLTAVQLRHGKQEAIAAVKALLNGRTVLHLESQRWETEAGATAGPPKEQYQIATVDKNQ